MKKLRAVYRTGVRHYYIYQQGSDEAIAKVLGNTKIEQRVIAELIVNAINTKLTKNGNNKIKYPEGLPKEDSSSG